MTDGLEHNPMSAPRYSGPVTFMRTPLVRDPSQLDIALIGVPFDGGAENRAGQRHGPREVRNMSSLLRAIHHVTRVNPYELCRVGDLGDVPMQLIFDLEASHAAIMELFHSVHAAGTVPLSVGGDHSISLPILRAIAANGSVGLVHIDAHTDTCDEEFGSKFTRLGVDADSLDPAFAPGTGTPEIGGITTIEAQALLRGLRGLDLIGGDVVEVSPPFDPSGTTALVGATMMYEILCLLAEAVVRRG